MSKVKKRDEQEALKLDERFKRILTHVKTYITNLTSVEEAHLCRIWLDKLNSTVLQRNLRNEYLSELSRQLRSGTLEGIFKTEPPNSLLMPLASSCQAVCISSSLSELSDWDRNQNFLMLTQSSKQKNHLRNKSKLRDSNSSLSSALYAPRCHDTIEENHLELCKYRIDVLTTMLENLRIQNARLRQKSTTKCRKNNEVDNEKFPLRNRIKQLTGRAQIRSLAWKVRILKKTTAKLKKLNNTIKHVYEKKLQHIIKNKNLEIKILQLQFQEQKSKLCLFLRSEKQNELYNLMESLENEYKTLLAVALESQRRDYFTKIIALEAELHCLRKPILESSKKCM